MFEDFLNKIIDFVKFLWEKYNSQLFAIASWWMVWVLYKVAGWHDWLPIYGSALSIAISSLILYKNIPLSMILSMAAMWLSNVPYKALLKLSKTVERMSILDVSKYNARLTAAITVLILLLMTKYMMKKLPKKSE